MLHEIDEKWLRKVDPEKAVPEGKDRVVLWDSGQKGLGLIIYRAGGLSWVLRYSVHGHPGKMTLGQWPDLTYAMAKTKAQKIRGQIADGVDPARKADPISFKELVDRIRKDEYPKLADSTVRTYNVLLDSHILPALGRVQVGEINLQDVAKLHHRMRGTKRNANQALAVVSRALSLAETWGFRPPNSNPCTAVERYQETKRTRYLTREEMAALGDALRALEPIWNAYAVAALRFAMFTGMRRGEVSGLKWSQVQGDRIILKQHKTAKASGDKTIHLSIPARALLDGLTKTLGCPYVFAGEQGGTCLSSLRRLWDKVRTGTSFADVRIHDLRHTFASIGVMEGLSLEQIGGLLGHKAAATTKRYAHLMEEAATEAASKVGSGVAERLG